MMWWRPAVRLLSRAAPLGTRSLRTKKDGTPLGRRPTPLVVAPPEGLQIKLRPGKNPRPIEISWWQPKGMPDPCQYNVRVSFFDPKCMVTPFKIIPQLTGPMKHPQIKGLNAYVVDHPHDSLQADPRPAFTMAVTVTTQIGDTISEESLKTITRESVLVSPEQDWKKNTELLRGSISNFRRVKGSTFRAAVVGPQHHGKSSLVNHLLRCLRQDTDIADEMEAAPAGPAETTVVVNTVTQSFEDLKFRLHDIPAIANFSGEHKQAFDALLMGNVPDGTRRYRFTDLKFLKGDPPHVVIIVVSLLHWRDQQEEMQAYLSEMQKRLKSASNDHLAFPYVVAATHRDVFLEECDNADPYEALGRALDGIRSSANTNSVFAVTNYQENSPCSPEVNEETYRLLRQALVLSQNVDTAVLQKKWQHILRVGNPLGRYLHKCFNL